MTDLDVTRFSCAQSISGADRAGAIMASPSPDRYEVLEDGKRNNGSLATYYFLTCLLKI